MLNPLLLLLAAIVILLLAHYAFWPDSGFVFRWKRARQMTERVLIEDALKHIFNCETTGDRPSIESIAGALDVSTHQAVELIGKIEAGQMIRREEGFIRLTPEGRQSASHILRAHRLWERYLADATGFAEEEWHARAEYAEHHLSATEMDDLAAQLGHPTHDPHGDPIPSAEGEWVSPGGIPLTAAEVGQTLRIVHIEDEPQVIYAQLIAEGLHPGMTLTVLEVSPKRVRFWADGEEHLLAPMFAANISAVQMPQEQEPVATSTWRLSSLKPGQRGEMIGISPACRGLERRRLLDLGFLPGAVVDAEFTSPRGDPTAYRIRDTLIALRNEQARWIYIKPMEEA
jgi:DtxR family Mn-dependent transcriptional regulator